MKYRLFIGSYTNYRINRKYRRSEMPGQVSSFKVLQSTLNLVYQSMTGDRQTEHPTFITTGQLLVQ